MQQTVMPLPVKGAIIFQILSLKGVIVRMKR